MDKQEDRALQKDEWGLWPTHRQFILFLLAACLIMGVFHLWHEAELPVTGNLFTWLLKNYLHSLFESTVRLLALLIPYYFFQAFFRKKNSAQKLVYFSGLAILSTFFEEAFEIVTTTNESWSHVFPFGRGLLLDMCGDFFLYILILCILNYVDTILMDKHVLFQTVLDKNLLLAREESEHLKSKLKTLQSQLNPHFLFNTLNNLSTLISKDPGQAHALTKDLALLFRKVLGASQHATWCLGEEIKLVKHYLNIESVRFGSRLEYEIRVPEELAEIKVPTLLLQPLVENALKHGIARSIRGGCVSVEGSANGGLELRVTNTLIDPQSDESDVTPPPGEMTGLLNLRKRLDILYGEQAFFSFKQTPHGATVALRLPQENIL